MGYRELPTSARGCVNGATSRSTDELQNMIGLSGLPRRYREGLEQSAAVDHVVAIVAPV